MHAVTRTRDREKKHRILPHLLSGCPAHLTVVCPDHAATLLLPLFLSFFRLFPSLAWHGHHWKDNVRKRVMSCEGTDAPSPPSSPSLLLSVLLLWRRLCFAADSIFLTLCRPTLESSFVSSSPEKAPPSPPPSVLRDESFHRFCPFVLHSSIHCH